FLVSDKTGRKTSTEEAHVKEWVKYTNEHIFEPQINVRFELLSITPITVDADLGDPIDLKLLSIDIPVVQHKNASEQLWHLSTKDGDLKPTVFNVFCGWPFKVAGSSSDQAYGAFVCAKVGSAAEMEKGILNRNMCLMKGSQDFLAASQRKFVFA